MSAVKESHSTYSIQLASKISGVGVHTIRAWEKRYQAVTPRRNASGRREYDDADIERLSLLSELCTLGHSISKIANLTKDDLKKQLRKLGKSPQTNESKKKTSFLKPKYDLKSSLNLLVNAIKEYKLNVITEEINRLKILLDSRSLALDIIAPLIREAKKDQISAAKQSALASILKFHMGHILFRDTHKKSTKPYRVLICTPEEVHSELTILQTALLCNFYNFEFFYLGSNLPVNSLLEASHSLECNMIFVSDDSETQESFDRISKYATRVLRDLKNVQMTIVHSHEGSNTNKPRNTNIIHSIEAVNDYLKDL